MAVYDYSAADLETLSLGVLFGDRSVRLLAMNTFRGVNSKTDVEYLVNAQQYGQDDVDAAVSNTTDAASGSTVSVDSEDLEVVFTAALTKDRKYRLDVLNIFREAQSKEAVDYLVNAYQPSYDAVATAISNIESDSV